MVSDPNPVFKFLWILGTKVCRKYSKSGSGQYQTRSETLGRTQEPNDDVHKSDEYKWLLCVSRLTSTTWDSEILSSFRPAPSIRATGCSTPAQRFVLIYILIILLVYYSYKYLYVFFICMYCKQISTYMVVVIVA